MPPLEEPQPTEHQRQAVATWLARELARIDRVTPPDPGRVTARRLNRTEYNNTVRDLLGVDLRPADDFPQDDAGYGFDNIGDVLSLSPALMEKYVTAAERVARRRSSARRTSSRRSTQLRSDGAPAGRAQRRAPRQYDLTGLSLPNAFHAASPRPGRGRVRRSGSVLGGARPAARRRSPWRCGSTSSRSQSQVYDPEGAARSSTIARTSAGRRASSGSSWRRASITSRSPSRASTKDCPRAIAGRIRRTRPEPARRRSSRRRTPRPSRSRRRSKKFEETQAELQKIPLNGARVGSVEVGGPYSQATGPSRASLDRIYTCGHLHGGHQPVCVAQIMTDLARRAFRRPVTPRRGRAATCGLVRPAQKQEATRSTKAGRRHSGAPGLARFPVPHRDGTGPADGRRLRQPISQLRAGVAPVVLPLGQHAGRRAADARRTPARCAIPRCSTAQVRRMLQDPKVAGARGALRRPVAAVPRPGVGRRPTASAFRTSTTTCGSRCAGRPSCSSSTSSARTAASSTSSTASTRS